MLKGEQIVSMIPMIRFPSNTGQFLDQDCTIKHQMCYTEADKQLQYERLRFFSVYSSYKEQYFAEGDMRRIHD